MCYTLKETDDGGNREETKRHLKLVFPWNTFSNVSHFYMNVIEIETSNVEGIVKRKKDIKE